MTTIVHTDPKTNQELMDFLGSRARNAAAQLAKLNPCVKNDALLAIAKAIDDRAAEIAQENQRDIDKAPEYGLTDAQIDRLRLNDKRIGEMIMALRQVAELEDPVGSIFDMKTRPNGLRVGRMRAPIGVIGIIYESRPNVTVDAGALCVKSGNAVILRGGKEAFHSNTILAKIMNEAGSGAGLPANAVQLVPTTDREMVGLMAKADAFIDLIIPRGGKGLIERVVQEATIPVIKHYDGICHVFVDAHADLDMAVMIAVNSKTQRPGVCNAMETLLVHKRVAEEYLKRLALTLQKKGTEVRGDARTRELIPWANEATLEDWSTEYLDNILSVAVVESFDDAVQHINRFGSRHTDAIVTRDYHRAMRFLREVDSACVFVNASTRFSDGGEFGMGCEIGISTDKLHARGPMGLVELTSAKFVVFGDGQVRQ